MNNYTDPLQLADGEAAGPLDMWVEDIGLVKAAFVTRNTKYNLLVLTLETPLKRSLPFFPELTVDALQIYADTKKVQAWLFGEPIKIPYALSPESKPQDLCVNAIRLLPYGGELYYLLELSYPVDTGNDNFAKQLLVDANGRLVGQKLAHITF